MHAGITIRCVNPFATLTTDTLLMLSNRVQKHTSRRKDSQMVEGEGFEPSKLSQRIYSPPQLATLVPLRSLQEHSLAMRNQ